MTKSLSKEVATAPARALADIRRPIQRRSRERFESILNTAEKLLETLAPDEISIHRIASELDMSAASIYHFFPDPALVFAALAERYLGVFERAAAEALPQDFDTWQDLQTYGFRSARDFFNANAPARKVLLGGPALSYDIRRMDLQSDAKMAALGLQQMASQFVLPDIPDLIGRSIEVIVISDALWALSIHLHGTITEEMEERARRARIAYARTYLPEYLHKRERADR